jgi:pimeloyl-ACP methyl ester carboxylesterase
VPLPTAGPLAYRTAGPPDGAPVLLLHGWPQSSWMWRPIVAALGEAGFRAIAPDFPGYGDSMARRPATWHTHMQALHEFFSALGIESAALVVHDWGGLIGLRWACDHPGVANALVISDTGLFPDGRWHGFAKVLQTPGDGEAAIEQMTREAFGAVFAQASPGMTESDLDEYFRPFTTPEGREAQLELYRSGDFSELEPYEGKLAALGVPTLMLWGEADPFAPIGGARRFEREIPGSELEVVEGIGHFVTDDAPDEYARRLIAFLRRAG